MATAQRKRRSFTANRTDEIMTYAGIVFRPLAPEPHMIVVEDVAHALANSCRYTGHVREFYSVAQHSVYVSELLETYDHDVADPQELCLWGLMHDGSEAYLSDLARPVKHQPGFGETYREVETKLQEAVAQAFDLSWPIPDSVHWADNILLRAEQRDLMPGEYPVEEANKFWPETIEGWLPQYAEAAFLERFHELTGR